MHLWLILINLIGNTLEIGSVAHVSSGKTPSEAPARRVSLGLGFSGLDGLSMIDSKVAASALLNLVSGLLREISLESLAAWGSGHEKKSASGCQIMGDRGHAGELSSLQLASETCITLVRHMSLLLSVLVPAADLMDSSSELISGKAEVDQPVRLLLRQIFRRANGFGVALSVLMSLPRLAALFISDPGGSDENRLVSTCYLIKCLSSVQLTATRLISAAFFNSPTNQQYFREVIGYGSFASAIISGLNGISELQALMDSITSKKKSDLYSPIEHAPSSVAPGCSGGLCKEDEPSPKVSRAADFSFDAVIVALSELTEGNFTGAQVIQCFCVFSTYPVSFFKFYFIVHSLESTSTFL
jgi:hypothetical protein